MRVLVVAPTLPWPLDAGGRIRTASLLRELAPRHELTLACVRQEGAGPEAEQAVRSLGVELEVHPRGRRSLLQRLSGPAEEGWFWSPALARRLARADHEGHDLVHLDELCLVRSLPRELHTPLLVHHHKLDRELAAALARGPASSRLEVSRWDLLEREALRRSRSHATTTTVDAERLASRHPGLEPGVVPNGFDATVAPPSTAERDPDLLLALGSLDYPPNSLGLARFLRHGWPRVRRARPAARLAIVGRGTPVTPLGPLPEGVELVGEVPDPGPWLRRARALLVPLEVGGGSRLKVLEAAAHGLPVVATRTGAEGLDLEHGRHLHLAEDLQQLGELAGWALGHSTELKECATAARDRVLRDYTWGGAAMALEAAWERAVQASR